MVPLVGVLVLIIAVFAVIIVNNNSAKKQRSLVGAAIVADIIAVAMGGMAGSAKTASLNCFSAPLTQYVAWALGAAAFVFACINLYLAIRGKALWQIIVALLFAVLSLVTLGVAWFLSTFCLTF